MDEKQLLAEIERLKQSPYVKLAKKTENQMLRQKLYNLRNLEKRGREIAKTLNMEVDDGGQADACEHHN